MGVVEAPSGEAPVWRKVRMSDELFRVLGTQVEWGEPDADGFYTPTVYKTVEYTYGDPRKFRSEDDATAGQEDPVVA